MESDTQSMSMLKDELVKTFPGLEIEEHGDLEGFIIKSALRNSLGWLDPLYTVYVASHGYSGFRAINNYRKGIAIEDEKELIVNRTLQEVMTALKLDFQRFGGILPTFPTVEELITKILFGDIHGVPYDGYTRPAYVKAGYEIPGDGEEDLEAQTREAIAATLLYRFKTGRWCGEKSEPQPMHMGETDAYIDHVYCEVCGNCVTCNLRPCREGGAHTPRTV